MRLSSMIEYHSSFLNLTRNVGSVLRRSIHRAPNSAQSIKLISGAAESLAWSAEQPEIRAQRHPAALEHYSTMNIAELQIMKMSSDVGLGAVLCYAVSRQFTPGLSDPASPGRFSLYHLVRIVNKDKNWASYEIWGALGTIVAWPTNQLALSRIKKA
ncbi:hypothetical protein BJX70DRAFT_371106 [Aspergillus crustosus]